MEVSKADADLRKVSPGSFFLFFVIGALLHAVYLLLNFGIARVVRIDDADWSVPQSSRVAGVV